MAIDTHSKVSKRKKINTCYFKVPYTKINQQHVLIVKNFRAKTSSFSGIIPKIDIGGSDGYDHKE